MAVKGHFDNKRLLQLNINKKKATQEKKENLEKEKVFLRFFSFRA